MKLSDQALSCVMMALQKSLVEQSDIVPVLKNFDLELEGEELFVKNPPQTMKFNREESKEFIGD